MNKKNLGLLSIAFMFIASFAFAMNGNTSTNEISDQLAYALYENEFDGKCGDGKCGDGKTKKEVKAKKTDAKTKAAGTKSELKTEAHKEVKVVKEVGTKKETKCGDGKATTEAKAKTSKKEKCGSGKCGDGK